MRDRPRTIRDALREFVNTQGNSGMVLVGAAIAALALTNTAAHGWYAGLLQLPLHLELGPVVLHKSLLQWVNDGLMAIFFFVIGLELKQEFVAGSLSTPDKIRLPVFAAVGGMAVPALLFVLFNHGDAVALRGWAVPTATDIAFSLGVLMLLGARVPTGLKAFLLALAILDDLGAVLIIALYYSEGLSAPHLLAAAGCLALLAACNRCGLRSPAPYLLVGAVLWYFVLKSGVHATIAGVLLAFTIPARPADGGPSPLQNLEHDLNRWVAFLILPVFAFCNAGIYLLDISLAELGDSLTLGVLLGLLLGKPLGICLFTALALALGLGSLPQRVRWPDFAGMACLCGIGFTMSLFVSMLAYDGMPLLIEESRLGILLGSLLSALAGYFILRAALPPAPPAPAPERGGGG